VDTAKDLTEGDSKEHESTNITNVEIDSLTTVLVNHNREQGTRPNNIFREHFPFSLLYLKSLLWKLQTIQFWKHLVML